MGYWRGLIDSSKITTFDDIKIIRKNIKRYNLKVLSDTSALLSVPYYVSESEIKKFLISKADWLASAKAKMSKKTTVVKIADFTLCHTHITFLAQSIPVTINIGAENAACLDKSGISLQVKEYNIELVRKVLADFFKIKLKKVVSAFIAKYISKFAEFPSASITFRYMSSRWGSCNPTKCRISFNIYLVYAPLECIEYIIMHEYVHFLCKGHSSLFYEKLSLYMPDWRNRAKLLDSFTII